VTCEKKSKVKFVECSVRKIL